MPGTNDFQTFATAGGANVITQANYLSLAAKATGFQSGIAASAQLNKVWRQSSIISAMIAQFICDETGNNATDDGTIATLEANFIAALQAVTLVKVVGALNLYVNPSTGADTNNGLSLSTAFKTIQAAANSANAGYIFNSNPLNINLAAGTYTGGLVVVGMPLGCTQINIIGGASQAAATSYQITITSGNGIVAGSGSIVSVSGVQFTCSGSISVGTGYGVSANKGLIIVTNCVFGSCGGPQISASANGGVVLYSSTFTGNSAYALTAGVGFISALSTTLTYNSPTYSICNANATFGYISLVGTTCPGTATGTRFLTNNGGIISTNGAGINLLPGTVAGSNSTGGQYT